MEYPEIGSSHVVPEMHDSTGEDDALLSMFHRANEDRAFYSAMLSAVVNHDLSTLNLPAEVEARLSHMLTFREHDPPRGNSRSSTYVRRGQDDALIAELRREGRKDGAECFRRKYSYGSSMEQKFLVWPGGTYPWTDNSSGIPWVGVHGMDSICVVTRAGDLDVTRVHRDLKYATIEKVLRKFRSTVISEIEDLESPSSKLSEIFGRSIPKPFSVVSVVLGTDNTHNESCHEASSDEEEEDKEDEEDEVSSDENESIENKRARYKKYFRKKEKSRLRSLPKAAGYDEKKTIKFLREQLRRNTTMTINEATKVNGINASSTDYDETEAIKFLLEKMKMRIEAFTVDETIKTAICAFQHLFQKKFKASEIEVSVMDPNYFVTTREADHKDIYVNHLEMSDIEDHLAAINGGSGNGPPTITFVMESEHLGVINGPGNGGCLSVGSGSGGSSSD